MPTIEEMSGLIDQWGTAMTGADLYDCIKPLAALHGWLVHHDRPARRADGSWYTAIEGDAGFPDLVLARRGRVIFGELKGDDDTLRANQAIWLTALRGRGSRQSSLDPFEVYVWRPTQWLDGTIERILE